MLTFYAVDWIDTENVGRIANVVLEDGYTELIAA